MVSLLLIMFFLYFTFITCDQIPTFSCQVVSKPVMKLASYEVTMKRPIDISTINIPIIQPTCLMNAEVLYDRFKQNISTIFIPSSSCSEATSQRQDTFITVTTSSGECPTTYKETQSQIPSSSTKKKTKSYSYSTITDTSVEASTSKHSRTDSQSKSKKYTLSTITDTYYETKTHTSKSPMTQGKHVYKKSKKSNSDMVSDGKYDKKASTDVEKISSKETTSGGVVGFFKGLLNSAPTPTTISPSE